MKTRPEKAKEHEEEYSNFDCAPPEGAEKILKEGNHYIAHPAHDHWGAIWFEGGKFYEEVKVYRSHVATISGDTIEEVFALVNDEYGWD